jgi:hypothetical protein
VAVAWPVSLQDKLNSDSFSYAFGDTVIRSKNDIGLDKVRRVSTRPIDKVQAAINLDYSEYLVFETFLKTSINGGVSKFTYTHPLTGVLTEFRFTGPPSIRPIGGRSFIISMEWEIL